MLELSTIKFVLNEDGTYSLIKTDGTEYEKKFTLETVLHFIATEGQELIEEKNKK